MTIRRSRITAVALAAAAVSFGGWAGGLPKAHAQAGGNRPVEPLRIADGLYYVGASDYAAYMIETPEGLIVIDGGDAPTGRQVLTNLRALGFDPRQVKVLLNTHAHFDHAGGLALLKRETGATLYASEADGALMARGGKGDFHLGDRFPYEAVTPDRIVRDKETVTLGGVTLTAHLTPGHTRGCTTWTFPVRVAGRERRALLHCSHTVLPGYRLTPPETYQGQAQDYARSFEFWRSAPCEVFLANHAGLIGLERKREALRLGDADAFVDPEGCRAFVEKGYAAFQAEMEKQRR